jgi:16S rRNA (adenine1518-N6/adenine1519-N6)-dimethyltransferase
VVEIGPGQGALTRHLSESCDRLTLVELDNDLAARLAEEFKSRKDVQVIHRDVLRVPLTDIAPDPSTLKVVGNIPYNITAPILFHLLARPRPAQVVLMVQREVADRIVAEPGTREYGALAVGVQTVARPEFLFRVPAKAFRPVPRVESAVVRITPLDPPPLSPEEEDRVRTLTRVAFGWRRKQFQKILRSSPEYGRSPEAIQELEARTGLDLTQRPERFSPDEFVRLAEALNSGL